MQLSVFLRRFFGLSPSPSAQLALCCKLLCMKDSHSLLKVYFVLLPIEGNYQLALLLNDSKQLLGFRLGHIPSQSENYEHTTVKIKGKKTPVGCSDLRKQNCLKVLRQSLSLFGARSISTFNTYCFEHHGFKRF